MNREEQRRQWYLDNRERILEDRKRYREQNKDRISEYQKKYRASNKDTISKKSKEYREKNRDVILERNKTWIKENRDLHRQYCRKSELRREYGITPDDYDRILVSQRGCCKICGSTPTRKSLEVDHNHETGVVRGLLCHKCNKALGLLRDSPPVVKRALAYLLGELDD